MGFGRRIVRKSVRRVTPRPVRKAMHPARTVRNAVTPRPVKQASRAVYTVRHPVGAAENKAIGAVLYSPRPRRGKRSLWALLTGEDVTGQLRLAQSQAPADRLPPPASAAPPRPTAPPWPTRQAFRSPPPSAPPVQQPSASQPSSAGEWEFETRRQTGLGGGSRH
jgi:hypothetical protein